MCGVGLEIAEDVEATVDDTELGTEVRLVAEEDIEVEVTDVVAGCCSEGCWVVWITELPRFGVIAVPEDLELH